MKKSIYLIVLALILSLVLTGCLLSNVGQVPTTNQGGVSYLTRDPEFDPRVINLIAGQNLTVGTVEVWDDGLQLCVTYKLNDTALGDGWLIYETHWDAGALGIGIPINKKGNPQVGLFSGGEDDLGGVAFYSECITFAKLDIECANPFNVAAHAVVGQRDANCPAVMYGTSGVIGDSDKIYEIDVSTLTANMLFNTYPLNTHINGPNGNAYDPDNNRLYYSKYTSEDSLHFYNFTDSANNPAGPLTGGQVASGGWYNGEYYYIPQSSGNLYKASFNADGIITGTTLLHTYGMNFGAFGDIAITPDGLIYGSSNMNPAKFWSIDLNSYLYTEISEMPHMQLAFGSDGLLYGHDAGEGNFYWIDPLNGVRSLIGAVGGLKFTDLASGPYAPCAPSSETAWADGDRFVDKGNWATYFFYEPECECTEQLWQIGTPNGLVNPIVGAAEYPATGAYSEEYLYVVGDDLDPIGAPSMPGYIGSTNVCSIDPNRPCTDTTMSLNIQFDLYCSHVESELVLIYDRYGSETDTLYFDFDGTPFATVVATEGGFKKFNLPLPAAAAGTHTITIAYEGGGDANGHYIDYLELVDN